MSIEEICTKADYLIILAPSDPEKHLGLAKSTLPCGKRTYIDKTFAPSYAVAKDIFDIARTSGTAIFSTSALRYATELSEFEAPTRVVTTGGGGNLPEYIIHQVEMGVKKLGTGAKTVTVTEEGEEAVCRVTYPDSRSLEMRYNQKHPFTFSDGKRTAKITSDFFRGLIADILRFFEGAPTPVEKEETLEVMKIREATVKAYESLGTTVEI